MPKYFMSGTRLEEFERMMMDPSRTARDDDPEEQEQGQASAPKQSMAEDSVWII